MLAVPPLLGAAAARPAGAAAALLSAALLFLFLARYAAVPAVARAVQGKPAPPGALPPRLLWSGLYLGTSGGFLLGALSLTPSPSRAAALSAALVTATLGGAQTLFALAGRDRSTPAEILGMAGLASAAPLIVVSAGRPLDGRAAGVGLLALAYFLSSLAYVRAVRRLWRGDPRAGARCVAAHAAMLLGLLALWRLRWIPALSLLSFTPVLARTAWGLVSPPGTLRILGFREIGVAVLFVVVAMAALASG
jgi:hypothetical protein